MIVCQNPIRNDSLAWNSKMSGDWPIYKHLTNVNTDREPEKYFKPGSPLSHAFQLVVQR